MSRTIWTLAFVLAVVALPRPSTTPLASADEPAAKPWPPGVVIYQQSDEAKKIRAALEAPIAFEFLDTPLGDVVSFLESQSDINVELDPEALAADGKGSDLPITKTGKFSSLANGLELLLGGQGLTYVVTNDVLLITTKTAASTPENLSTRLYQVHDLVVAANDPTAAKPDFESLVDLLTSTIRQNDWQDNGGTIGVIHSYQGPGILALVATHDEQGHREIEQLLKMLRESRVPQIAEAQAKQPFETAEPPSPEVISGGTVVEPKVLPAAAVPAPTPENPQQKSGGGFF